MEWARLENAPVLSDFLPLPFARQDGRRIRLPDGDPGRHARGGGNSRRGRGNTIIHKFYSLSIEILDKPRFSEKFAPISHGLDAVSQGLAQKAARRSRDGGQGLAALRRERKCAADGPMWAYIRDSSSSAPTGAQGVRRRRRSASGRMWASAPTGAVVIRMPGLLAQPRRVYMGFVIL